MSESTADIDAAIKANIEKSLSEIPHPSLRTGSSVYGSTKIFPDYQAENGESYFTLIHGIPHESSVSFVAILQGDAIADLAGAIDSRTGGGHPVVMNSWMLSYLTTDEREAYVAALDEVGARRDLSWIALEAPAQTPGLPWAVDDEGSERTVVLQATWRDGRREVRHLADAHPHGFWLHWRG